MPSRNRVELLGHAGQDAETKFVGSEGKMLVNFSMATTEKYNGQEYTTWHRVQAWQYAAQQAQHIRKGDLVHVDGKLKTESWEKDGQKHYRTVVVGNVVLICQLFKDDQGQGQGNQAPPPQEEDDFPF